jgi:sugar phosphate isomerase/epimerase
VHLGIFAKIFVRPTLGATLDAVVSHGLDCVQFNFACAGLPSMPDKINPALAAQIGREARQRNITIAAVSGTFNMIDSNLAQRQAGLRRLEEMAASCAALGASIITLCTGTRDSEDMWRHHPLNEGAEAWRDLLQSMTAALKIADKYNITLGIEPETANVISSASKARRLLDDMGSPRLKIVMDASNLFHPGDRANREDVLTEAFDLLGDDLVLAHAKDFRDTGKMEYVAPGKGILPWAHYLQLLRASKFDGPLIIHSLPEAEVESSVAFLRNKMAFVHDGIHFNYRETGRGVPFFFLHGLGGDVSQPFGLFHPPAGVKLLSFDCRAHGQTSPVGPDEKVNFSSFADDLLALMDYLEISQAVIGGISMGAGVALNFALRHPRRLLGLILDRPAWLDEPRHDSVEVYGAIARLMRQHGTVKGLEIFEGLPLYQSILARSPATARSLAWQFQAPRAAETVVKLERIPLDAPNYDRAQWRGIRVPTLVLANRQDQIHPFEFGETLAREIPGAEFKELTAKSVSPERHLQDTQQFIENFLRRHFLNKTTPVLC